MSPLSVAWAPHYVKEAKLGHSHFLGRRHGHGIKYLPLDTVQALKMFLKGSVCFGSVRLSVL